MKLSEMTRKCDELANEAAQTEHPPAKWTLLIYQASDNNLSEDSVYALTEIEKAVNKARSLRAANQKNPPSHIIARLDPVGRGNRTVIFELTQDRKTASQKKAPISRLEEKIVYCFPRETDSTRWSELLTFLTENIRRYPAEHYMVVLAGHGGGALDGFFLSDDSRHLSSVPSALQIRFLKRVFGDKKLKRLLGKRKIDVLGFDSCVMSTVEVSYQLRGCNTVKTVVGSEGFSLNSGWPYEAIAAKLESANAPNDAEELAEFIVDEHIKFYGDYYLGGLSVDIAAIRLNRLGGLVTKISKLALELESHMGKGPYVQEGEPFQDAVLLAHWGSQSFNGEQCVDLYDFCNLLRQRLVKLQSHKPLQRRCKAVMDLIFPTQANVTAVVKTRYMGPAFQYSHGISIYFPWSPMDVAPEYSPREAYRKLEFVKDSHWDEFLSKYHEATKRHARDKQTWFDTRSTPPYTKGPDGKVHSMRNPPTGF